MNISVSQDEFQSRDDRVIVAACQRSLAHRVVGDRAGRQHAYRRQYLWLLMILLVILRKDSVACHGAQHPKGGVGQHGAAGRKKKTID